jgi:Cu-processing system ATP-binding protein
MKGADETECSGLLERVGLAAAAGRPVGQYSKGMRQRLGFAQALLGKPALLFLDEPTTGLDPEAIHEFYQAAHGLRAEGVTIILSSHILSEIQERVSRLAILRSGRLQATGSVHELREKMDLPLTMVLLLADGSPMADIRRDLMTAGAEALHFDNRELRLSCARKSKMAVLAAVAALHETVRDVHVREPSLEDVYLGYTA